MPPPSPDTLLLRRCFWGVKHQQGGCGQTASASPHGVADSDPKLHRQLCPDEITSSPPAPGQLFGCWGRASASPTGSPKLHKPPSQAWLTPPPPPPCGPQTPCAPLTAELRAGLCACSQAEEQQGHHQRGHHGATTALCHHPVPAAAGAGAGAGTAVTMGPSVPCRATEAALGSWDSTGTSGTGSRGCVFEGCAADGGGQWGPQPAPRFLLTAGRIHACCSLCPSTCPVIECRGGREGLPLLSRGRKLSSFTDCLQKVLSLSKLELG